MRFSRSSQNVSKTSSQKRSIVTPNPAAAALIQASYKATRSPTARKMRAGRKNQFANELEIFINDEVKNCKNSWEEHLIYREAFDAMTRKFPSYSDSMILIKDGYEGLIDRFADEIKEGNLTKQTKEKSQNEYLKLIDIQKQKIQSKRDKYDLLEKQLHEQISRMIFNDKTQKQN